MTVLLIRHGETDANGKLLAGRQTGWHLNSRGESQAMSLAKSLSEFSISAFYTSPMERTIETATTLARPHNLEPIVRAGLNECDFGPSWEGRTFESLNQEPSWHAFNSHKSAAHPPGGERMIQVQERMVEECEELRNRHPHGTIGLVSHADPIKTIVAYYLAISLDEMPRFQIGNASVTAIRFVDETPTLLFLNRCGEISL